ncbi:hypothetical protein GH714_014965 [Hevea brasiliensis]|uniref:Cation-transporting ATPase n=1 Tax=Hevea brasiliensis TaxID=3981 RepID=A0A6A6M931_HEVBR|nr:hypothetical protein GH714_014965 [Hevea brasiliensis]
MSSFHVGGKVVERVDLLRKKHWAWRLDVWPFAILYVLWFTIVPSIDIADAAIVLGGLVALHILVWLFTAWSVNFKCFVQFSKVHDIHLADACKITPAKFSGSKEVVPLHFRKQLEGSSSLGDREEIYFDFRKQRFIYSKEEETFCKLPYPTKETFGNYLKITGHGSEGKVVAATEKWGRNVWVKLPGTDLLPGDVVSIGRSSGPSGEDKSVPADMLLLAGSAIVNEAILTGESTPQWKVSIMGRGTEEKLSIKRDKSHVLFGGTKILQHTPDKTFPLRTPDGGCVAVVLRTGFETSQGKLMRTILFSTDRVTANSWESGLFILFLVVFAVIAAGYVLKKGLEDPTRSKYKLFLSCSLIITSVIPPELPMELSIAVNTSLIALARRGIFCTEPFRIPFAGKVDICCFDKTGTLTSDDMEFCGVVGLNDGMNLESDMTKVPVRTVEILASCHALVFVDNKLVGDPLEKAALKGIDWSYKSDEKAMPKRGGGNAVQIVQRHHFASHLKRMAVVVRIQDEFLAFVKVWAPETIQDRLIDLPQSYVDTYKKYTRQGSRVLALAFKSLPDMTVSEARSLDRDVVESGLTFAGFAVFNCPIRADSATILSELKNSSHDLVMITGDQALTACHVASQVHIISKPALILGRARHPEGYEWISPDEAEKSITKVGALSETHDLCIGGDCIEMLQQSSAVLRVIPHVKVFARVAPEQKELIMTTFKTVGRITLMCGDGTNDVGALKQAHVGVALLNAVPPAQSGNSSTEISKDGNPKFIKSKKSKPTSEVAGKSSNLNGEGSMKGKVVAKSDSSSPLVGNRPQTAAEVQRQKLKKLMDEMNEEGDGRSAPIVKLAERPHPNIFCFYVFLSLMGQFSVHLFFLISSVKEAEKYMPDECIEPDSDFHPNLVNTVSYMVSMMLQVATFAVNYMGHPFNQSITENKPFLYALLAAVGFFTVITSDLFRDLNDWLKLVPLPPGLRNKLLVWAFLMFLVCHTWERLLRWAFPGRIPAWRKRQQLAEANLGKKKNV